MEPALIVRSATDADVGAWASLREALWPGAGLHEHRAEIVAALPAMGERAAAFVAVEAGEIVGFVEASLRHDHVNGCTTSPVAFVEGIYVRPERRGRDVGRALCAAVIAWGRKLGCAELASDALLENTDSHAFHLALGFEETERVVFFRMTL